ncbi:cytidylyltransferase domain-containing protein [Flavobacterium sp.]|uniref:cytidylyltransferase domain-containing protein n=1 Tax=Flavobacterium sp. TaxID=239 RepID=UPI003F696536
MNNLGFIIQARIGSTRLPQKMILPFYNDLSVIEILINKIQDSFQNIPIILATSVNSENDILENIGLQKGCKVFRGDEKDVLSRFCNAAKENKIDQIIRICADNPFLDIKELKRLVDFSNGNNADYISFKVDGVPSIKTHFGFWAEYTTLEALEKIKINTSSHFYHEHVTNYIYENPSKFKIKFISPNVKINNQNDIRMTLDTKKDFMLLSEIFAALYSRFKLSFGIDEIIDFLKDNTKYQEEMLLEITKNIK